MSKEDSLKYLADFENHYDYDCTYIREMLEVCPEGFQTFENFMPMGQYQKVVPKDILMIAKVASMKTEDCGACVQLNIRMAIEAGVSPISVKAIINDGEGLEGEEKDMYLFATAMATNSSVSDDLVAKIESRYSREGMVELGLAIASTKIYPAIKRTLGYAKSCAIYDFEY